MRDAYGKTIPLRMITEPKYLFYIVTQESDTSKRRLDIDLKSVKDAIKSDEV